MQKLVAGYNVPKYISLTLHIKFNSFIYGLDPTYVARKTGES